MVNNWSHIHSTVSKYSELGANYERQARTYAHPLHHENKHLQSNTFVIMVYATQANHYLGCCKGAEVSAL